MHNRLCEWFATLAGMGIGLGVLSAAGCDYEFIWGGDSDPGVVPPPSGVEEEKHDIPGSLALEKLPPLFDRITGKDIEPDLIVDNDAAIALGKALFWDMQSGSDGQACASCHFSAGADNRSRNQLSPGLLGGNGKFDKTRTGGKGPNLQLVAADYPFHVLKDPEDRNSKVLFDSDDVTSSQGVRRADFIAVKPGFINDKCETVPDPPFQVDGINVRRVEPRNAPTVINAAFNFRNFWDGRANRWFNGVDPFGRRNKDAFILEVKGNKPVKRKLEIVNGSLASQATGPVVSPFEASCQGRTLTDVGRKLVRAPTIPLGFQKVLPDDSVLGPLAAPNKGLETTYAKMIEAAFAAKLWKSDLYFDADKNVLADPNKVPADQRFTLMETNFSLFWGLAIQAYERTLVSANTPFDRFRDGRDKNALGKHQLAGLDIFLNQGKCVNCHKTAMFTSASTLHLIDEFEEEGLVERMLMTEEDQNYGVRTDPPFKVRPFTLWKKGKGERTLSLDVEATPTAKGDKIVPGAAIGQIVLSKVDDDDSCVYDPESMTFGVDDSPSRDIRIDAERKSGSGCPSKLRIFLRDDFKVEGEFLDFVLVQDGGGELEFVGYGPSSLLDLREPALYDNGFYNIGVRPTAEDIGVGGEDPFGNPLSFTEQYVQMLLGKDVRDPFEVDPCTFDVPWSVVVDGPLFPGGFRDKTKCDGKLKTATGEPKDNKANERFIKNLRTAVNGAFKVPTLRNSQLTAPYMHNGGMSTLEQVVEFYNRGGDFHRNRELDPDITRLELNAQQRADLVLFLQSLTDPDVVFQRAPFDHPQLFVPNGLDKVVDVAPADGRADDDPIKDGLEIPAVGAGGSNKPIRTFLNLEGNDLPKP
ncbi:cytochrome c peroxidase [Nannocystis bainbridge]|uniref:Cytochrome c peroxidase n=1 Tax=Nannocystis bainbridge TaxID=2995303 RepID=A0ABT5EBD8_9BACT|nr:cytochrome c peroxidase [Nannocystis bainbridge]MDC0722743.1 cytochrome c peroxidase [Nannocystis bainbridge]